MSLCILLGLAKIPAKPRAASIKRPVSPVNENPSTAGSDATDTIPTSSAASRQHQVDIDRCQQLLLLRQILPRQRMLCQPLCR